MKKVYLIDYSGYNHSEWNELLTEEQLQQLLEEIEKHKWVRPDIWIIDVKTVEVLLDFLGKLGICGLPADTIKERLDEILEKLETC